MQSTFFSLKTAVVLLLSIAGMSILGTVVSGLDGGMQAQGTGISGIWRVLDVLHLADTYHSPWFIGLACLLGLNLTGCMYRRVRKITQKRIPAFPAHMKAEEFILTDKAPEEFLETCTGILRKRYRVKKTSGTSEGWLLYAERQRLRQAGTFLLHASVLIILSGVALGALGFDATLEIPERATTDRVYLKDGMAKPLDFQIRCDAFDVDYYANGMPKEFTTHLSFMRGNRIIRQALLRVNHPVVFEGMHIYQASYRTDGSALIKVVEGKRLIWVRAEQGQIIPLNTALRARVMRVEQDLMHLGPAVQLAVEATNGAHTVWILRDIERMREHMPGILERIPAFNPSPVPPYTFALASVETRFSTGLAVNSDPGAPVAAMGGILLMTGTLLIFLTPAQRIWIRIGPLGGSQRLSFVHTRNGMQTEPDRELYQALKSLSKG